MAIIDKRTGESRYEGATLKESYKYWLDGMEEVFTWVWDLESHSVKSFTTGYYAITGQDQASYEATYEPISDEVRTDIMRTLREKARINFSESVIQYKNSIHKGTMAEVIRGRKVKKGTILNVFWVGERETWKSRQYDWMNETEEVAGAYDPDGNKVWIRTDYLKNIDPLKSPNRKERKKYISSYIKRQAKELGIQ